MRRSWQARTLLVLAFIATFTLGLLVQRSGLFDPIAKYWSDIFYLTRRHPHRTCDQRGHGAARVPDWRRRPGRTDLHRHRPQRAGHDAGRRGADRAARGARRPARRRRILLAGPARGESAAIVAGIRRRSTRIWRTHMNIKGARSILAARALLGLGAATAAAP